MDSNIINGATYIYDTEEVKKLISQLENEFGRKFVKKIDVIYNSLSKDFGDFREKMEVNLDEVYKSTRR